ncbi:MAG: CvpA family protein [Sulfurimonas sp.]|jgi:membrane protein required for colicin V production|nr:CvpA family protein [Sulfurimonas sp.]MBU1215907.1 CvpA family protein [bacterium]MBU1435586.1 CvpA family protein [bacterium]MBU1502490.1 CvpA family protein [bacterium]MBU3938133.1 CvpA family protein [bacterium]
MEFSYFDLVAAVIILLLGLKGIINGFFKEAFGLIGIIGGIFIASRVGNEVGEYLSELIFKFENSAAVNFTGFLVTLAAFWFIMVISGALFKKLSSMSGLGPVDKLFGFILGSSKFFLIAAVIAHAAYNIKAVKSTLDPIMQNSTLFPILVETGAFIMKIDPVEISDDINATIMKSTEILDANVTELTQSKTSQIIDEVKSALEQNSTKLPTQSEKK